MKTAYTFRFGTIFLEYEEGVLLRLRCTEEPHIISENDLRGRSVFSDRVVQQVTEYLDGKRRDLDIPYRAEGTVFQKQVWNALLEIPYGETRTYGQIAKNIGNPKAVRAVGMANNRNPLMLLIPCHRVIGADGSLTGYAGGLPMKQYLLELEGKG